VSLRLRLRLRLRLPLVVVVVVVVVAAAAHPLGPPHPQPPARLRHYYCTSRLATGCYGESVTLNEGGAPTRKSFGSQFRARWTHSQTT